MDDEHDEQSKRKRRVISVLAHDDGNFPLPIQKKIDLMVNESIVFSKKLEIPFTIFCAAMMQIIIAAWMRIVIQKNKWKLWFDLSRRFYPKEEGIYINILLRCKHTYIMVL